MEELTIQQKITVALAMAEMTQAELAERFGASAPAFSKRLKTGKFTQTELEKIAEILHCKYHNYFEFPDGNRVE